MHPNPKVLALKMKISKLTVLGLVNKKNVR